MPSNPVKSFVLKAFFWLPACFGLWYLLADWLSLPSNLLLAWTMPELLPNLIHEIGIQGSSLEVVTEIAPTMPAGSSVPQGQIGALAFDLNPLIYGYGLPLFTALMLAAPDDDDPAFFINLAIGFVLLSLVQSFGAGMDILKTLAFSLGPDAAKAAALGSWQKEAVALGYQMGTLILPAVTPVLLWLGMNRKQLAEWAPGANID